MADGVVVGSAIVRQHARRRAAPRASPTRRASSGPPSTPDRVGKRSALAGSTDQPLGRARMGNGAGRNEVPVSVTHDLIIIGGGAGGLGAGSSRALGEGRRADGHRRAHRRRLHLHRLRAVEDAHRRRHATGSASPRRWPGSHDTVDRIAATETADVLRAEGIEVIEGRARSSPPTRSRSASRRLTAPPHRDRHGRATVRAADSRHSTAVDALTNETVFDLTDRPGRSGDHRRRPDRL